MGFFGALGVIIGLLLTAGSLFYIYERFVLLIERKYSGCPKNLLKYQYMADGLLLFKYFVILLYGLGIICLIISPIMGISLVFFISLVCLLHNASSQICYKKYGLKSTFYNLHEKWESGVNYKTYEDEVNVYRAIRDSQNWGILFFACLVHFITFIIVLI